MLARWAPPALFLLVALLHLHQNQTANLNPWFGGGFAMFSTTYRPWPQALSIEAEDASEKRYLVSWIPQRFGPRGLYAHEKLLAQPDSGALSAVAQQALQSSRRGGGAAPRQALAAIEHAGLSGRVRFRDGDAAAASKIEALLAMPEALAAKLDAAAPSDFGLVHARARVWRLAFDSKEARFFAIPIGQAGEASLSK